MLILPVVVAHSQEWVVSYNGPGDSVDVGRSIAVDNSGNVYVTGLSCGPGSGSDYATVKYNSAGVEEWVSRYNGPGNGGDSANAIAVDGSGNVYVTGASSGQGSGSDYATVKYNSVGVEQWVSRYNGPGNEGDCAHSIMVDNSGNVYVTGLSSGGATEDDFATIKYDSTGEEQWVMRYNGPPENGWDGAYAMTMDDSGNIYVTGYSCSGTYYDYATLKYNSAGDEQWLARYNGPGNYNDEARAIAVDKAGNVYITGYGEGSGTSSDFGTVKYNSSGERQWVVRYNGPGNGWDGGFDLVLDDSANVYVTGYSFNSGTYADYTTIKYDSAGTEKWVARYSGPGNAGDYAFAMAKDNLDNIYITGESRGAGTWDDYATVKYNSAGEEQWVSRYDGPTDSLDIAWSIAVDNSGYVYVTGGSCSSTFGDYTTIKYGQAGGSAEVAKPLPAACFMETPRPNPASGPVEIRYSLSANTHAVLSIYDVSGKLVKSFPLAPHSSLLAKIIIWDGRDDSGASVPTGLYFVLLVTPEYSATQKLILVR